MSMIGKFAVCKHGKIGKIDSMSKRKSVNGTTTVYRGRTLTGAKWSSSNPRFLDKDDVAFLGLVTGNPDRDGSATIVITDPDAFDEGWPGK